MTASKEIKKALKAAFPTVKFSVTTKHSLCETVTVKWTGGAFINEVKEACTTWNTFKNHSDVMTDYFHYTGIQIKYERNLSDKEIEMLKEEIPKHYPTIINGRSVEWDQPHDQFSWLDSNGEIDWRNDFGYRQLSANKAVKNYSETGSIEVSEEDKLSERVMLSQIGYTWECEQILGNNSNAEVCESQSNKKKYHELTEQEWNDWYALNHHELDWKNNERAIDLYTRLNFPDIYKFELFKSYAHYDDNNSWKVVAMVGDGVIGIEDKEGNYSVQRIWIDHNGEFIYPPSETWVHGEGKLHAFEIVEETEENFTINYPSPEVQAAYERVKEENEKAFEPIHITKIIIHWSEASGDEEMEYKSAKDAQKAMRKWYDNDPYNLPQKGDGYDKTKCSIFFSNGDVYREMQIDLCEYDENPFTIENIFLYHCQEWVELLKKGAWGATPEKAAEWGQFLGYDWYYIPNNEIYEKVFQVLEITPEQEFTAVKNTQQDDLKTRYEQWVMTLIEKGQSAKIISFEDWKAIADFILA
jgi:hypothetical protein